MNVVERSIYIRRKVGSGKRRDKKLDRKAQTISLGVAEGRDRPCLCRVRIGCRATVSVHCPAGRDRQTTHRMVVDLAHGNDAGCEIQHESVASRRDADRDRIGADQGLRSAEWVHERFAGRHDNADQAVSCGGFRIIGKHSHVIGVADRGNGEPCLLKDPSRDAHGVHHDDWAKTAFAVDAQK